MARKELLLQLIDHLYDFEASQEGKSEPSFSDFLGYLNAKAGDPATQARKIGGDEAPWIETDHRSDQSDITMLLVLLYRYAKGYVKKVLKDATIQSADEFSFLITLISFKSLTKSELINKQVLEKTSGTEVIKRLSKMGMIYEFPDPDDKRSVRVAITDRGKAEIMSLLPKMGMVSHLVSGDLSRQEVSTLLYLLRKLDHFHFEIFENRKDENLESLIGGNSQKQP